MTTAIVTPSTKYIYDRSNTQNLLQKKMTLTYKGEDSRTLFSIREVENAINKVRARLATQRRPGRKPYEIQCGFRSTADFMMRPVSLKAHKDVSKEFHMRHKNMIYEEFLDSKFFENKTEKKIKFFWIIVTQRSTKGGASPNNNCLWRCLVKSGFKGVFGKPSLLRHYLGVAKDEPIDVKYIPRIEKRLNCGIFISGDVTRTPSDSFKLNIHLKLENGHYTLSNQHKLREKWITSYDRDICVFSKSVSDGYDCWNADGAFTVEDMGEVDKKEFIKISLKQCLQTIITDKADYKQNKEKYNLEWAYNEMTRQFGLIREYTQNKLNLFRSGYINDTIYHHLIYHFNHLGISPDDIPIEEGVWLNDAITGSYYIRTQGDPEGEPITYDCVSSFPAILGSSTFYIPVKKGEFTTVGQITVDSERPRYGLYKCIIGGNSPQFKYNKTNTYSHFDINVAHQLGLPVTVIDQTPNALLYSCRKTKASSDVACLTGSQMFGEYISWIYGLKVAHPDAVLLKHLISQIHGMLAEKLRYTHKISGDKGYIDCDEVTYDEYMNGDCLVMKTYKQAKIFKLPFARVYPFLLSRQRQEMYNTVLSRYWDDIIEFRTDGGKFKKSIPEFDQNVKEMGRVIRK